LQRQRDVGASCYVFERGSYVDGEYCGVAGGFAVGDVIHETYGQTTNIGWPVLEVFAGGWESCGESAERREVKDSPGLDGRFVGRRYLKG